MTSEELKALAAERALDVAMWLFPRGRKQGPEWKVGDLEGNPGDSLSINVALKRGVWKDFASDEGGDNLIALAMKAKNASFPDACQSVADFLNVPFERQRPDGSPAHQNGSAAPRAGVSTQRSEPTKDRPKRDTRAPKNLPEYQWDDAVDRGTDELLAKVAEARKLPLAFLQWAHTARLLGFIDKGGLRLAFPVQDRDGRVVAAHYRAPDQVDQTTGAKKKVWRYDYEGAQGPGTQPWLIGDLSRTNNVYVLESQWDAFALMAKLGVHETENWEALFAIFITRGASNGGLLSQVAREGRTFILWPQNDEPKENGKIPSEDWVKQCLEAAGQCPVRRVDTPNKYEDPDAWIKEAEPAPAEVFDLVAKARPARDFRLPAMKSVSLWENPANRPPEPAQLVSGLLHQGSKMIIAAPSKGRKTWALMHFALAVATGVPWWGFSTISGNVLYLNFELQEFAFSSRIAWLAKRMEVALPDALQVMTLRGECRPIEELAGELIEYVLQCPPFALIVVDPAYKLMAGRDENKVGDVMMILQSLERIAVATGAAIAIAHHYSKGNQSAKESIDRMGGSGAFARDPDTILMMTTHEEDECFTIEPTLRNFARVPPFVVRWAAPIFEQAPDLHPDDLKQVRRPTPQGGARINDAFLTAQTKLAPLFRDRRIVNQTEAAMALGDSKLPEKMRAGRTSVVNYLKDLREAKYIEKVTVPKSGYQATDLWKGLDGDADDSETEKPSRKAS